jgi:hypothetical protein
MMEAVKGNIQHLQYRQPGQWKLTVAWNHPFGNSASQ